MMLLVAPNLKFIFCKYGILFRYHYDQLEIAAQELGSRFMRESFASFGSEVVRNIFDLFIGSETISLIRVP